MIPIIVSVSMVWTLYFTMAKGYPESSPYTIVREFSSKEDCVKTGNLLYKLNDRYYSGITSICIETEK